MFVRLRNRLGQRGGERGALQRVAARKARSVFQQIKSCEEYKQLQVHMHANWGYTKTVASEFPHPESGSISTCTGLIRHG